MEDLPDIVLENVLAYVGNAKDFRSMERSCKQLHASLSNDQLWNLCEEMNYKEDTTIRNEENGNEADERGEVGAGEARNYPALYKDYAMACLAWKEVKKWQESSKPIFLTVVTVNEWKAFLYKIKKEFGMAVHVEDTNLYIRGDTSAVLLSYVENLVVSQFLNQALTLAIIRCGSSKEEYPEVCCQDAENLPRLGIPVSKMPDTWTLSKHYGVSIETRDLIVRRFAFRAGITKLNYDLIGFTWTLIVAFLRSLFLNIIDETETIAYYCPDDWEHGEKQPLPEKSMTWTKQTMYHIPPAPTVRDVCPGMCFTIVPGQVEEAARRLEMDVTFLHDDAWHVESDEMNLDCQTRKEKEALERQKAEDEYRFVSQEEFNDWLESGDVFEDEDPSAFWDPSTMEFSDSDDEVVSWDGSEMSEDSD